MATAYGQRPSQIVGVDDEWAAYQLDLATLKLGREVELRLAKGETIEAVLRSYEEPGGVDGSQFRNPMGMARKMKIPESGIW